MNAILIALAVLAVFVWMCLLERLWSPADLPVRDSAFAGDAWTDVARAVGVISPDQPVPFWPADFAASEREVSS